MTFKGIDISKWQNNIDWQKVKNQGITFVIIRCSYSTSTDTLFKTHIADAVTNGLNVGVYCYSEALDIRTAISEAKHVISLIKPYHLTYPVCYDMESNAMKSLSDSQRTDIAVAFLKEIENAGYYTCLYANRYWLCNMFEQDRLKPYDKWLAEWTDKPLYEGTYGLWQHAVSYIDGIGRCDCDIAYKDYPSIIKNMNRKNYTDTTLKIGSHVRYNGYVQYSSFGVGKPVFANGTFTVRRIISARPYGVLIDNLGWISKKDCTVVS